MAHRTADNLNRRPETRIAMRIAPTHKAVIERAAEARGLSLTDYITSIALADAKKVLAEQTVFTLDAEAFDRVVAAMGEPAQANPRLQRLIDNNRKSRWAVTRKP